MGLRYSRIPNGKPNCFESADVQVVNGVRDIPYTGQLIAILVPTDSDRDCHLLGVILDDQGTLVVDCLHADEEVIAFRRTCSKNKVAVTEHGKAIAVPCPPPTNVTQVSTWAAGLHKQLSSSS